MKLAYKKSYQMSELRVLKGGGNACALLSKAPGRKDHVIRISGAPGGFEDAQTLMRLQRVLKWGVPIVFEVKQLRYDELDNEIIDLLDHVKCSDLKQRWQLEKPVITFTEIEYADSGELDKVPKDELVRVTYLLLGLLYAAQYNLHFEHGDLTPWNVVLDRDDDGYLVPKIIDMDFASFHGFEQSDRYLGSYYVRPLEFTTRNVPSTQRKVLGAVDTWAVGIFLLGQFVGRDRSAYITYWDPSIANELGLRYDDDNRIEANTHYLTAAFHAVLFGQFIESYGVFKEDDESTKYLTRAKVFYESVRRVYGQRLSRLPHEQLTLLRQLLHPNPLERVFHYDYARYLDMAFFQSVSKDLFTSKIRPLVKYTGRKRPLTNSKPVDQLVQTYYSIGVEMRCHQCATGIASHADLDANSLLCGACVSIN